MNDPVIKLVEQSGNCKHWSGADALQDAMNCISEQKKPVEKLLVLWYRDDGESSECCYRAAGVSSSEKIAMLQVFLSMAVENFRGK